MIEFCLTLCYCHDDILDVLAGKPAGKNCGNCELVKDGNKIGKVPAICTKSKSQCATQVNYASLKSHSDERIFLSFCILFTCLEKNGKFCKKNDKNRSSKFLALVFF